jgi:MFS family permease
MLAGGWLADAITTRSARPLATRRYLCAGCFLTAAVCLGAGVRCDDPMAVAVLWGVSFGAMHVTMPNWWSVVVPQCGRHVGTLSGLMNGVGVIGAMASQGFVGVYADWRGAAGYSGREQWDPMIDVYCGALVLAAVAWWAYRFRPLPDHPPP